MFSRVSNLFSLGKGLFKSPYTCSCRVVQFEVFNKKRTFCSKSNREKLSSDETAEEESEHNLTYAVDQKYKVFRDEDSQIIFDVDEERNKINLAELIREEEYEDPYAGINLTRGITGVYEIEDLIDVLKKDNARNIFVVAVPPEYAYVDYIVIVSGKSVKHMIAMATFVRKIFKLKKHSGDIIPKIEGETSKDWIALDLGNIALHIFSKNAREIFDLESLWACGAKYDDQMNRKDPQAEVYERYDAFLKEMQPADG